MIQRLAVLAASLTACAGIRVAPAPPDLPARALVYALPATELRLDVHAVTAVEKPTEAGRKCPRVIACRQGACVRHELGAVELTRFTVPDRAHRYRIAGPGAGRFRSRVGPGGLLDAGSDSLEPVVLRFALDRVPAPPAISRARCANTYRDYASALENLYDRRLNLLSGAGISGIGKEAFEAMVARLDREILRFERLFVERAERSETRGFDVALPEGDASERPIACFDDATGWGGRDQLILVASVVDPSARAAEDEAKAEARGLAFRVPARLELELVRRTPISARKDPKACDPEALMDPEGAADASLWKASIPLPQRGIVRALPGGPGGSPSSERARLDPHTGALLPKP